MEVIILGAGIAGLAVARDLALRGFGVTIIERGHVGSGSTARGAGQLHSGARYAWLDQDFARLCARENRILSRIMPPGLIGESAVYLVVDQFRDFADDFEAACYATDIDVIHRDVQWIADRVPRLAPGVNRGYETPDRRADVPAVVDCYVRDIQLRKAVLLDHATVAGATWRQGRWNLGVSRDSGERLTLLADCIVNATGEQLCDVGRVLGVAFPVSVVYGTMLLSRDRFSDHILCLCCPPRPGDTIVPRPQGSVIGSTWQIGRQVGPDEVLTAVRTAGLMVAPDPELDQAAPVSGARVFPVAVLADASRREPSVTISLQRSDDGGPVVSVLPGNFTLHRHAAELAANAVCHVCHVLPRPQTAEVNLLSADDAGSSRVRE